MPLKFFLVFIIIWLMHIEISVNCTFFVVLLLLQLIIIHYYQWNCVTLYSLWLFLFFLNYWEPCEKRTKMTIKTTTFSLWNSNHLYFTPFRLNPFNYYIVWWLVLLLFFMFNSQLLVSVNAFIFCVNEYIIVRILHNYKTTNLFVNTR